MEQKRILAMHDISCIGRCSLTVALPVISASGAECSVMPTAVLSTHTGGFTGYTFRDLTDDIQKIIDHWSTLGIGFDGIYTGYLGSFEQLRLVSEIIKKYKTPSNHIIIDPVMADDGKLYPLFDMNFVSGMKNLCTLADVVVPNATEASFMLGEEYQSIPYTKAYAEKLLHGMYNIGCKNVVLTGVSLTEDEIGAACYDGKSIEYFFTPKVEGMYHGTGDVFASAFTGAYVNGHSLYESMKIAVLYTHSTIVTTYEANTDRKYGVAFEKCLPYYIKLLGLK